MAADENILMFELVSAKYLRVTPELPSGSFQQRVGDDCAGDRSDGSVL